MARKTAIHTTNAIEAAAEYRKSARLDAMTADGHTPTVLEVIRAARDILTAPELMRLATDAARLELRPPSFGAEDRKDCAAEIVWHIVAETSAAANDSSLVGLPRRASNHATLTYACGLAKNWRRALQRRRAAEERTRVANEDAYAMSAAASLDVIPDAPETYSPAYLAASARQTVDAAHQVAATIVDRLELPRGGAVYACMYQWARGRTAEVCAADNGVKLNAWKVRTHRGAALIRALYPDPSDLIDAARDFLGLLTDSEPITVGQTIVYSVEDYSRAAGSTAPGWTMMRERDQRTREGTADGAAPDKPQSVEDARGMCAIRHQCPTPGLADIGRAAIRRGHYVHAPLVGWADTSTAPRGFLYMPGRTLRQLRADALRNLAREHATRQTREPSVLPHAA